MNSQTPDEKQFLALISENRQRILKICRVYSRNAEDQDDLYQEVLFQIWRSLPQLKHENFANTWLYRTALNAAISFTRKHKNWNQRALHVDPQKMSDLVESRQVHDKSNDQLSSLYYGISQLDDMAKALITLFLEDLNYDEMAEIMGTTPGNVGVMLHRAKKKLGHLMEQKHD